MTEVETKNFARCKTLKATAILVGFLVLLLLFVETRGDFANGILFFMDGIANIHTVIILIILFGLTYYYAGVAGLEIILNRHQTFSVSVKYVIPISLAVSIYSFSIAYFREKDFTSEGIRNAMSLYFVPLFIKTAVALLLVWLWATNKMKSCRV